MTVNREPSTVHRAAQRFAGVELSLIRQINALATPFSINLGIGEPNVEPDRALRAMAKRAAETGSWHYTPNPGAMSLRKKLCEGTPFDPQSETCVTACAFQGSLVRHAIGYMACGHKTGGGFAMPA